MASAQAAHFPEHLRRGIIIRSEFARVSQRAIPAQNPIYLRRERVIS